jgi:hypothetical protein
LSSDGETGTPGQSRAGVVALATCAILVTGLFLAILAQPDGCQSEAPGTPCEDQAPPECLVKTIEQATSSQFEHYVYCACVTVEGLSKGYVAASNSPVSTQKLLEITGRGRAD